MVTRSPRNRKTLTNKFPTQTEAGRSADRPRHGRSRRPGEAPTAPHRRAARLRRREILRFDGGRKNSLEHRAVRAFAPALLGFGDELLRILGGRGRREKKGGSRCDSHTEIISLRALGYRSSMSALISPALQTFIAQAAARSRGRSGRGPDHGSRSAVTKARARCSKDSTACWRPFARSTSLRCS